MSKAVDLEFVEARVHGRYLIRRPAGGVVPVGHLVGFHGFGESAGQHMDELVKIPGLDDWTLVAVEALHPFYTRSGQVVACWMTRQDREMAIDENVAYVRTVLDAVLTTPASGPVAIIGFSQGTEMAYRAAARAGRQIAAVIALGGDVPPELAESSELPFDRVLIGRGQDEEWYGSEKLAGDVELLRTLGIEPELLEYEGGHEWTDPFRERAARFLRSTL
jgi:predicted esterase